MIKKFLAFGILASTLLASSAALADSFRGYLEVPVTNLDPIFINNEASRQVSQLIHRGLVAYSPTILPPRNGAFHQVVPAIAGSWELSPDRKSYIFTLDPDARFHNGRPVTASDVKYSFERLANPLLDSPGYWAIERLNIQGLRRYQAACRAGIQEPHLLGVEVMDHDIVQIHLEHAIPYALELLALPYFSIVPAEDVERWWKDYRTHPIGAGPYRLDELALSKTGDQVLTQKIDLQRFSQFYGLQQGLPRTESLHFELMPQAKDQFMAFTRRELDHAPLPTSFFHKVLVDPVWNPMGETRMLQAEQVANLEESHVLKTPSWTTDFISMDNAAFPFDDPKVRQAFNYAVDKRVIVENLLGSYAHPVTGVFPPGFPGALNHAPVYAQDRELARKLLFETGWRDKYASGSIEPWQHKSWDHMLYYRDPENSLRVCRQIQSDLASIGVRIKLAPLKSYLDTHDGQYPSFYHTSSAPEILDPSQLFYPTFHSTQMKTNLTHYANPRVDELVGHAEDLTYEPRRYELYREAERLIVDDAPLLWLYHPVNYQMVQPRVRQYMVHPVLPFAYELFDVGIKTAER